MTRRSLLLIASALALAGCGPQGYLHPAGPAGHDLAAVGWLAIVLLSAASIITWAIIGWMAVRKRGTFAEHAPADQGGGQRWIVIGGVAFPVVVLTVLFVATLTTLREFPMAHVQMDEPDIRVTGHQWWFDAEYLPGGSICGSAADDIGKRAAALPEGQRASFVVHAPTQIHIPVGKPVEIELVSHDVIHSFWVPKLHGKVDLIPGQKNRVRIQADQPGVYEGECGEYCGVQHAHMRLTVVAQPVEQYVGWLNRQREPAAPSADAHVQAGRQVFERAACALCHRVRGTPAQGLVGPELTHVGSRQRIAGGTLPNTTANLEAWVTDAQSLKPGAQMPSLRQFKGEELRDLVAYLQSLK